MWDKRLNRIGDRLFMLRDRLEKTRDRLLHGTLGVTPQQVVSLGDVTRSVAAGASWGRLRQSKLIPIVLVAAALAITGKLAIPGGALASSAPNAPRAAQTANAYFFDLNTGLLFGGAAAQQAPLPAPSNAAEPDSSPAGVRAYVYSCGDCTNPDKQFIGYLEVFAPAGPATGPVEPAAKTPPGGALLHDAHRQLVARPSLDPDWKPASSEAGKAIIRDARHKCGESRFPNHCLPR